MKLPITKVHLVTAIGLLIGSLSVTTGCSYSSGANIRPFVSWTGLIPLQSIERNSRWAIDSNATVYLSTPTGIQDDALIRDMTEVFQRYYPRTRQSQFRESLQQAFVSARYAGMDYVVYPRLTSFQDQQSMGAVIREEINVEEFRIGEARFEILIFASQGEELVDHIKLDTKGSIFTGNSRALIWPPLDEYLRSVSQFNLARRE